VVSGQLIRYCIVNLYLMFIYMVWGMGSARCDLVGTSLLWTMSLSECICWRRNALEAQIQVFGRNGCGTYHTHLTVLSFSCRTQFSTNFMLG